MPDALPMLRTRTAAHGGIAERVVGRMAAPVPPSAHLFKCRLLFIRQGERIVGYDNERGIGDHRHLGGLEKAYRFVDADTLIRNFLSDVEKLT